MNEVRPMKPKVQACPVVIYDGQCRFCVMQVKKIKSRDCNGVFEYVPRQSPGLCQRFPQLADDDLDKGMRVVHTDGAISVGADAVYHIVRCLKGGKWVAWLYRLPVLNGLARAAYGWVAKNRYRLASKCQDDFCES